MLSKGTGRLVTTQGDIDQLLVDGAANLPMIKIKDRLRSRSYTPCNAAKGISDAH
jgi:hypothetical protein